MSRMLCLFAALVAGGCLWIVGPAQAAVGEGVFNSEGVWAVDVDGESCAASRVLDDGSTFLFRANRGGVTFGFFPRTRLKTGRSGRIELGVLGFSFKPGFLDGGMVLFGDGDFAPQAVGTLRSATELTVLVDERPVVRMTLTGTGFAAALDAAIDCSAGRSGWWGKGVEPAPAESGPAPTRRAENPVMNKEQVWSIAASDDPGVCVASADIDEHMSLQVLAASGLEGLAIATDRPMPRGRNARIETDGAAFNVQMTLDKDRRYLTMDDPLDSSALAILSRAKWMRLSLERQVLLDVQVDDTGLADVLHDVAACSKTASGWWGEGAKRRP